MSIYSQNEPKISHFLAIDFGESKVGLAMADTETKIAFVYKILPNDKNLTEELGKIIQKEDIRKIIIGIPEYKLPSNCHPELVSGSKSSQIRCRNKFGMTNCFEYKKWGEMLKEKLSVEVEYQEEMFTTKMAQDNLKERGNRNISQDDQEAARIILQDWLDKN
jgi:putative Holliday junction resolvase